MKRAMIAGGAFTLVLVVLGLAVGYRALRPNVDPAAAPSTAIAPSSAIEPSTAVTPTTATPATAAQQGFLYGRVTSVVGDTYEGRLRWGRGEEAFWGDYFNGSKKGNGWAALVSPERLPKERHTIKIFGVEIAQRERPMDLGRFFMSRFGDIARIEASGRDVRVTLKSGAVFELDRFSASDFDDGVRVWDDKHGVVDLDSLQIRSIELRPTARIAEAPDRLHGTVRTPHGDFTGFIQWNREACIGTDELDGYTDDGEVSLRFDTIRSIARRSDEHEGRTDDGEVSLSVNTIRSIARRSELGSLVTLLDGRKVVVSGTDDVGDGDGNRGIYVDDRRYGRVLISWNAFQSVEFSPGGSGPAYRDFPPGHPLTGSVTTRDGRRLIGRLVYDLDESETTETFDAPSQGVDYTIPFELIASIVLPGRKAPGAERARVTLHSGEELELERAGDLGERNAGMLIFVDGNQRPEYVPWTDVEQVDFGRPPRSS